MNVKTEHSEKDTLEAASSEEVQVSFAETFLIMLLPDSLANILKHPFVWLSNRKR